MSWPPNHVPKYRKHRASGQAIVNVGGKGHYLGPHGTKASHMIYDRLIAEYLSAGRQIVEPARPIYHGGRNPGRLLAVLQDLLRQGWQADK